MKNNPKLMYSLLLLLLQFLLIVVKLLGKLHPLFFGDAAFIGDS